MSAATVELDDQAWAATRDAIAQRFFRVDATEFARKYQAGEYEEDADFLMDVLAYFPELD